MSNDDTQNMVYLKIDIFNKNIVGIGKSIGTITDVEIPIDLNNDNMKALQRQIKGVTGTFDGNPVEMSIADVMAGKLLETTDNGKKILRLIDLIDHDDLPMEIGGSNGVTGQVNAESTVQLDPPLKPSFASSNVLSTQGGGLFGNKPLGKRPKTNLGSEIYDRWIKRFGEKFPTQLQRVTGFVPSNYKSDMIIFIDELTDAVNKEAAPTTEPPTEAATDAAPATEAATATDAYMNQLDGGKHTKHTKRNKRNKHRKTKRRQSRNT